MSPTANEYILEERFIHEALAERAHRAFNRACTIWQHDGHITPSVLFWPTDTVLATNGTPLEGVIVAVLPPVRARERTKLFGDALRIISPYGILTVEEESDPRALVGTFETSHGSRRWARRAHQHGDVYVLGPEAVTDNLHHLGLLWAPNRGAA